MEKQKKFQAQEKIETNKQKYGQLFLLGMDNYLLTLFITRIFFSALKYSNNAMCLCRFFIIGGLQNISMVKFDKEANQESSVV